MVDCGAPVVAVEFPPSPDVDAVDCPVPVLPSGPPDGTDWDPLPEGPVDPEPPGPWVDCGTPVDPVEFPPSPEVGALDCPVPVLPPDPPDGMVVTSWYSPDVVPEGPPERVPLPEGVELESPVLWVDCDTPVAEEPIPVCEPVAVPLEPLDRVSDPWAVPDD